MTSIILCKNNSKFKTVLTFSLDKVPTTEMEVSGAQEAEIEFDNSTGVQPILLLEDLNCKSTFI